ncbi:MAG: hypothetical protein IJR53_02710 [Bacteroidales bacterium]|nr:hypothetical protein [Bacteroidales bacterium]
MRNYNNELVEKIKDFGRKYQLNILYKGALIFIFVSILAFLIYVLLEYFSYFTPTVRKVLFFSYLAVFALLLVFFVLIPLFKYFGLGRQLSREQIAKMVGSYFPEIDDKLLNLLQLQDQLEQGDYKSYELLETAIQTKTAQLKPFPFVKAIRFENTTRYLKWAVIPILIFVLIFSIKSEVITEPTKRIVNYSQEYEKPAPYSIELLNKKLTTFQNDDFTIRMKIEGEELPNELYIVYNKKNYKCVKDNNSEFSYTFTNLRQNTEFQLYTDEVNSQTYTIEVLPKPVTIGFSMHLKYPSYLNKNEEVLDNVGTASVPEGTKISWQFYTKNTDSIEFIYQDHEMNLSSENDNFAAALTVHASFDYSIVNKNKFYTSKDTLNHSISVIKDLYPEIYVESRVDSFFIDRYYFKGNIKDDYGFSNLYFVYSKFDDKGQVIQSNVKVPIQIEKNAVIQDFYYSFEAAMFELSPGYSMAYHFEVYDNDGVNGSKMSKTGQFDYKVKTQEEIDKELDRTSTQAKSDMDNLMKESSQIMKDIEKMNRQLKETNNPSWQDKKKMEELLNKFNELKNQLQEMKKQQSMNNQLENQYKNYSEDILKKQQELEQRMDELLSDEMKNMLQQIQQMMENMNKDQMQNSIDKMKMDAKDINQTLDQQLQLYKELEMEKKVNEFLDKTRQLSQDEKNLSIQTQKKDISKENLQKQQQEIQQRYDELKKDLKEIKELNKELEQPNKLSNTDSLQQALEQDLNDAQQQLDKNNRSKASGSQKSASEKMEELADKLEQDMNESELEEVTEDIAVLRQILDNLVQISFDQEDVMKMTQRLSPRSSNYTNHIAKQNVVKNNMKMIEDSLLALARRQLSVKPFITKEVSKINNYIQSVYAGFDARNPKKAAQDQQFALTSMNNLSLMLAESMQEMKQKQSECKSKCKKAGNGSCNKPGGKGKSKKTRAKELQQQLNRQMEAMKRSMEQQGKQQQGQSGQQQWSEQFAKMAAQQEAIRKMMQDYQNQLKSENGVGDASLDKLIEEMQKTEKELVNRTLSDQTLIRQKDIETRMLESEKADRKQDEEKKRESTEGRDILNANPPKDWNLDKTKQSQQEMLRTVPVNLNYYYKEKVNNYFYNID